MSVGTHRAPMEHQDDIVWSAAVKRAIAYLYPPPPTPTTDKGKMGRGSVDASSLRFSFCRGRGVQLRMSQ